MTLRACRTIPWFCRAIPWFPGVDLGTCISKKVYSPGTFLWLGPCSGLQCSHPAVWAPLVAQKVANDKKFEQ